MRYVEFRELIARELRRHPDGLSWRQLKLQLELPYERPCPTWVARLEREIGLARVRGHGPALLWTLADSRPNDPRVEPAGPTRRPPAGRRPRRP